MNGRAVRLLAVTLLLGALLAPASLASAAPTEGFERDRWHDVFEGDVEECGLELYEQGDIRGSFVANTRGRDQLWFGAARVHGTYTLSNPDTGRSMQLRFTINDKDLDVRLNDDGTATLTVLHAGRWAWTTSDGIRLLDAGMVQFEGIWNYETDQFTFTRDLWSAGRFDTADRSWCDDVHEFLG
jgi:hypothetical protein